MGEVSRIHRVEPTTHLGDHLRVAQSGDRPDKKGRQEQGEEPEDQVELHVETPDEPTDTHPQTPSDDAPEPHEDRLSIDIAV